MEIIINANEDLETKEAIKEELTYIVESLKEIFLLNLTYLEQIIFTSDFNNDLQKLSELRLCKREIEYTNNSNARVAGKCVSYFKDGNLYKTIVIDLYQYFDLVHADVKNGLHLLHHELLHIHEKNLSYELLHDFLKRKFEPLESIYLDGAMTVFSEYYANRLSSSTATDSFLVLFTEVFTNSLSSFEKNVIDKKWEYKTHQINLDTYLEKYFNVYAPSLYQSAAYIIGYCHGLNKSLEELSPEANKILNGHIFKGTYRSLEKILFDIFDAFPDQWNENSYNAISENFKKYYEDIGIVYTFDRTEQQIRIAIH